MMKINIKIGINFMLLSSLLLACKGTEGPVGPQGVKGDTGLQGPKGDTGLQGPKGDTGGANIMSSNWVSVTLKDWQQITPTQFLLPINEGKITQDILEKGVVLVYGRSQSDSQTIFQLPITFSTAAGIQVYSILTSLGKIKINLVELSDIQTTPSIFQFRYVIIPSSAALSSSAIDYSKYEVLKKTFNLQD